MYQDFSAKTAKTLVYNNLYSLSPAVEFSSTGPAGDHQGDHLGRFELLIVEERDGSPVYQQAQSQEMPENNKVLLFRWENYHYSFHCIRSGDKWLVEREGIVASLKASVGANPFLPPATGWLFNRGREGFEEDPSLTCSMPSTSPPCCLMVTLSGAAKEACGDCEGKYKSTGLTSMGKQVTGTLQAFAIV